MARKHAKHLMLKTPQFAASFAQLQDNSLHPYMREQAVHRVFETCYPYVAQQAEAFADMVQEAGIPVEDMAQSAALKLWEYVNRPASAIGTETPGSYLRSAYKIVRTECMAACNKPSGMTDTEGADCPPERLDSVAGPFDHLARLHDESARADDALDVPATGLASQLPCPVPGPDEQVDLARQRDQVFAFAQKCLLPSQLSVISDYYGLEDGKNATMSFGEIAKARGVSAIRIQQIHERAVFRLRAHLDRDRAHVRAFALLLRNPA